MRTFKILGTGIYLPSKTVLSTSMDEELGFSEGWVEKKSGVFSRRIASEIESTTKMGASAALSASVDAGWEAIRDAKIDCIISAAGTVEQAIPCTAVLIQRELGLAKSMIPCFDINSTCLSFLNALDAATAFLEVGRFKRILIVSSEIPSLGLNKSDMESSLIFGDGAAAVIIEKAELGEPGSFTILAAHMETYSDGAEACQVLAGGTRCHPSKGFEDLREQALFEMDGKVAFKISATYIDNFVANLFKDSAFSLSDMDVVIPHQASMLAMHHLRKKLAIPAEKLVDIFATHGNQIAASMPTALHYARRTGRVNPGDKMLLIGTGAGISLSGMILRAA